MRRALAALLAASTATTAFAQAAPPDRAALLVAAEQAADQADQAAAEAEHAMVAARKAAQSARDAVAAARAAMGVAAIAPKPAAHVATASPATGGLDQNENLPVDQPTAAQVEPTTIGKADKDVLKTAIASSVANGPNSSALKSSPTPDLQLVAGDKDKVASVSWTLDLNSTSHGNTLNADQLTVSASAKLDDSGTTSIAGLDGFGSGAEIKLAYTHYSTGVSLSGKEKDPVSVARANCLQSPLSKPADCDPYKYATGVSTFVSKWNAAGLAPLLDEVLPGPVWFYGVNFTGNPATYKYLDRASFSTKKDNDFGFGAGLFGGVLLGHGQTSITASFDWKRAFTEQTSITLCQGVSATVQTQCLTAADGTPTRSSKALLGLEFRHAFPVGIGPFGSVAIAPKFEADAKNDAYSLSMPLYLVGDDTGKLRGGVQTVYTNMKAKDGSRDTDFTLGLFVGVPFSAFHQ